MAGHSTHTKKFITFYRITDGIKIVCTLISDTTNLMKNPISSSLLYPYGTKAGDKSFPSNIDCNNGAVQISIDSGFPFFGQTTSNLYVCSLPSFLNNNWLFINFSRLLLISYWSVNFQDFPDSWLSKLLTQCLRGNIWEFSAKIVAAFNARSSATISRNDFHSSSCFTSVLHSRIYFSL